MLDAGSWILDLDIANGQLHIVILTSLTSNFKSLIFTKISVFSACPVESGEDRIVRGGSIQTTHETIGRH
jgi:hypothetical protein